MKPVHSYGLAHLVAVAAGIAALIFYVAGGTRGISACRAPSACSMTSYKAAPGLTATAEAGGVALEWDGDGNNQVRLRLAIVGGAPVIRELAVKPRAGTWSVLAANAAPDIRIAAGFRRMSNQQLQPLVGLNVPITPDIIKQDKWDAFWDAPLNLDEPARTGGNPPPGAGIAGQQGLPRKPEEITRASAAYRVTSCDVKTNGARIEVSFPGVMLGPFKGRLQYTVYKGTNLIRQEIVATTSEPSVAYKYDAGVKGISVQAGARIAWRDPAGAWREDRLADSAAGKEIDLKTDNRLLIAEQGKAGSIAVFPPPHTFFWARELATNLGYSWYRHDSAQTFALGVRQAEREESQQYDGNFALYSARPGTEQRMPMYIYPSAASARDTQAPALAFTHADHYKPLAGYQVMNHHYHMDLGQRLLQAGSLDAPIPDLIALKALGITIVSQIDSVGTGGGGRQDPLAITAASVEGARRHSDKDFLVMPDQEFFNSPLGGHTDLLFSHPVYWTQGRAAGQPLSDQRPVYGTVYHIASADDLMQMATREDGMISMPHPRTKGSTGFPDAVKDEAFFKNPRYQGVGFRWGMGLDLSEKRLCELPMPAAAWTTWSNWVADSADSAEAITSISEARYQSPGDDIYAKFPARDVHQARVRAGGNRSQPGHCDADARRLVRDVRRSADPLVCG